MANQWHRDILQQGVYTWNQWRKEHPEIVPDLSGASFYEADLSNADLHKADLRHADLYKTNLCTSDLSEADLSQARLGGAVLVMANLNKADLSGADLHYTAFRMAKLASAKLYRAGLKGANLDGAMLSEADLIETNLTKTSFVNAQLDGAKLARAKLIGANLTDANLSGADLEEATLVETTLSNANLTGCRVYGVSAWNVKGTPKVQADLVITRHDEPLITVDNIKVAQLVYLLLHSEEVRDVINTITAKVVLILGRFTPERKAVLDALRTELRKHDFTPILFDFDKPTSRNLTETVSTLAHMARFVIADITDAKSIPQELQRIVPGLPSLPVQPIILASQYEYSMFIDLQDYPWVLPIYRYSDTDTLLTHLVPLVISPALTKAKEIEARRKAREEEMTKETGVGNATR